MSAIQTIIGMASSGLLFFDSLNSNERNSLKSFGTVTKTQKDGFLKGFQVAVGPHLNGQKVRVQFLFDSMSRSFFIQVSSNATFQMCSVTKESCVYGCYMDEENGWFYLPTTETSVVKGHVKSTQVIPSDEPTLHTFMKFEHECPKEMETLFESLNTKTNKKKSPLDILWSTLCPSHPMDVQFRINDSSIKKFSLGPWTQSRLVESIDIWNPMLYTISKTDTGMQVLSCVPARQIGLDFLESHSLVVNLENSSLEDACKRSMSIWKCPQIVKTSKCIPNSPLRRQTTNENLVERVDSFVKPTNEALGYVFPTLPHAYVKNRMFVVDNATAGASAALDAALKQIHSNHFLFRLSDVDFLPRRGSVHVSLEDRVRIQLFVRCVAFVASIVDTLGSMPKRWTVGLFGSSEASLQMRSVPLSGAQVASFNSFSTTLELQNLTSGEVPKAASFDIFETKECLVEVGFANDDSDWPLMYPVFGLNIGHPCMKKDLMQLRLLFVDSLISLFAKLAYVSDRQMLATSTFLSLDHLFIDDLKTDKKEAVVAVACLPRKQRRKRVVLDVASEDETLVEKLDETLVEKLDETLIEEESPGPTVVAPEVKKVVPSGSNGPLEFATHFSNVTTMATETKPVIVRQREEFSVYHKAYKYLEESGELEVLQVFQVETTEHEAKKQKQLSSIRTQIKSKTFTRGDKSYKRGGNNKDVSVKANLLLSEIKDAAAVGVSPQEVYNLMDELGATRPPTSKHTPTIAGVKRSRPTEDVSSAPSKRVRGPEIECIDMDLLDTANEMLYTTLPCDSFL